MAGFGVRKKVAESTSQADRLIQYGISSTLADRASAAGLGTGKIRALSLADLTMKYGLEQREAAELKKCVARQPIDSDLAQQLLARSNHLCCVCKGGKGHSVILHHIVEYERSQDNSYGNLAVLCPNDHDRAHSSGLSMGLTPKMIESAKEKWEHQVEVSNAQKAARALDVNVQAMDYVNTDASKRCACRHSAQYRLLFSVPIFGERIFSARAYCSTNGMFGRTFLMAHTCSIMPDATNRSIIDSFL